ncbi:hypothetical protein P154DRAFT_599554 [Amniculicola lignicola CBS 123094]|uniref:Uncharacterized protein n=1 Tax=Amniculicola lignicola CBS 123094 TaxID=1392246 RepID=A0A6A5WES2_9PLEO|nr:hypothetical protein P154DRAFT_599554 [Amniculicola lignicola CBS 123094]
MLTYSDREKFERIRAGWERAQPVSRMVGRKEKQAAQAANNSDLKDGSASKFRRKLSYGLSFISNPLSQRKTTPGRQHSNRRPMVPSSSARNLSAVAGPDESDRLLSPVRDSKPFDCPQIPPVSSTPLANASTPGYHHYRRDSNATPKALPRSRTMSFIPQPTKGESPSLTDSTRSSQQTPTAPPQALAPRRPTKIPSPNLAGSGTRNPSPRQHMSMQPPMHTPRQKKYIAAGRAFAGSRSVSPSKSSVRSYTTPNLAKSGNSPNPVINPPRKPGIPQKVMPSPNTRSSVLKENTPTVARDSRRTSQIQDKSSRRVTQVQQSVAPNRRSLGPSNTLGASKQPVGVTGPAKRVSSNLTTAKRGHVGNCAVPPRSSSFRKSNGSLIAQPRLMGPVNPLTPSAVEFATQPALPRANTDRDLRRSAFQSPERREGASSFLQTAGPNSEVRLPRSTTLLSFQPRRTHERVPPVPQIPEQYKDMSSWSLADDTSPTLIDEPSDGEGYLTDVFQSLTRGHGIPVSSSEPLFSQSSSSSRRLFTDNFMGCDELPTLAEYPHEEDNLEQPFHPPSVRKPIPSRQHPPPSLLPPVTVASGPSINLHEKTNIGTKVRDYMPALWWAGRFQSRYDQWRTEAMRAAVDQSYTPEDLLGHFHLDQEKAVATFIFRQLHELCETSIAQDSLYEFEYRYRQQNGLVVGNVLPPSLQNPPSEIVTPKQGTMSRAMRKLTPRKNSLVNLLKGKGWNREVEEKSTYDINEGGTDIF